MTPVAQECAISWCVKTIESSYSMGHHTEIITKRFLKTTSREQRYPWEAFPVDGDTVFTMFHGNVTGVQTRCKRPSAVLIYTAVSCKFTLLHRT
ncbi:hypothetical protein BDU57DRAFT_524713 [Ampelomyces quisqualis]|uniref:Uncharacterized protein n=1 Tax=Ampelomyces quisqualis TaxID=50730 RepID=A0A6A5Q9M9_AMPQU|nr:hypothetical protein BDU57DRAFT_524713 [Ampelomyces quisqualis]